MLALLYNGPRSERDWNVWSLSHFDSHQKIVQKIKAKGGPSLQLYQLDPINFHDFASFLNRNQQAHNDMTRQLNVSGVDLQSVDPKNENQLRAWVALHSKEHHDVEAALGI
jgi:hypothetical protein